MINHEAMAMRNRFGVLDLLLRQEGISQRGIARLAGLQPSTVSNIIRDLKQSGIVRESGVLEASRVGPKEMALEVDHSFCYAAALQMDLSGCELCLVNAAGHIVAREKFPADMPWDRIVGEVPAKIADLTAAWNLTSRRFAGLAVCVQGVVDSEAGRVLLSHSLKMRDVDLKTPLEEALGAAVFVERNIQCGAYMELYRGAARQHPTFIYYLLRRHGNEPLEQGLGMVINGANFRGSNSAAGELDQLFALPIPSEGQNLDGLYGACGKNLASIINFSDVACLVVCSDDPELTDARFLKMKTETTDGVLPVPRRKIEVLRSQIGVGGMLQGASLMALHRYLQKSISPAPKQTGPIKARA